jgi:Xaa-Pro aminopeptidase
MMIDIGNIQRLLVEYQLDGWLLYDFRRSNPIAHRLIGTSDTAHTTRRCALWIPSRGEATALVHAIEQHLFVHLPFKRTVYRSRLEWQTMLHCLVGSARCIATEYSPHGDLPAISFLDAGTAELLRSFGVELWSSGDLVQHIEAIWTAEQIEANRLVAAKLRSIMMESIEAARTLVLEGNATEYDLQQFILAAFEREELITDHPPIVAVGMNSASPHYEPTAASSAPLQRDTMLLLDMWAKGRTPDATYADITWTIWLGTSPPDEARHIARLVIGARDAALALVRERFRSGTPLYGYEVDDAARNLIAAAGYGEYFIHRTGHNIGTEVHGYGANMDNYETCDTRRVLAGTSFSIEPGIYLPGRFGFRSECDVVIDHDGRVHIPSEPLQNELLTVEL